MSTGPGFCPADDRNDAPDGRDALSGTGKNGWDSKSTSGGASALTEGAHARREELTTLIGRLCEKGL